MLPTGEGLFAFDSMDEVLNVFDAVNGNCERHSHAARDIAAEYFDSEKVLARLLAHLRLA